MNHNPTLFEDQRMGFAEAMEITAQSLIAYGGKYFDWAIAYSGGKDSSALLAAVIALITSGRVPRPRSLTVLNSDTRMELPPLQASAMKCLEVVEQLGFKTQVVTPPLDDRYFVYMLGRGVPPPSNRFRWCTPQLKVEPMLKALETLRAQTGRKLLMLTGVRIGESAARDSRIALSCGRDGAECGQGWFQETTPEHIADTLAPILHWRVCFVWDYLMFFKGEHGLPTQLVAEAYGGDEAEEINARTGCICCPLASRDVALNEILKMPRWKYLTPLAELKSIYRLIKKPRFRLRKDGTEKRADGKLVANPNRMGPLTFAARQETLAKILDVQHRVNAAAGEMPFVSLINAEEENRIRELIAAKTWPDRWDGTEPLASEPFDEVKRDGSVQPIFHTLMKTL